MMTIAAQILKRISLDEKLHPSQGIKKYIHDFIDSDDSRFAGDSRKKRIQRAVAAFLSAQRKAEED